MSDGILNNTETAKVRLHVAQKSMYIKEDPMPVSN